MALHSLGLCFHCEGPHVCARGTHLVAPLHTNSEDGLWKWLVQELWSPRHPEHGLEGTVGSTRHIPPVEFR